MRQSKYTKELLEPIVQKSISFAQVMKALGLEATGGNHRMISTRLRYLNIPTTHFKGKGWARGETPTTNQTIARLRLVNRRSNEQVFIENSPEGCGARIAKRLIEIGRPYECESCGISTWKDKPLSLHVDHVNGINNDNRLDDLRFLCPNCHSQTTSYCKKIESRGPVV